MDSRSLARRAGPAGSGALSEELCESAEGRAIVRRLFASAAKRAGGAAALGEQLGVSDSELRPYLTGDFLPPNDVILRTLDWVIENAWSGLPQRRAGSSQKLRTLS
jgi:hypothetical protein